MASAFLMAAAFLSFSAAAEYEVDRDQSVLAIVTHKTGFASRFAHNHFFYPGEYEAEASMPDDRLEEGRFRVSFPVTALVPDDPAAQKRWFPKIKAAGILDEPFKGLSDKDRAKVRESMLSPKQLDAEKHPRIEAEVKSIRAEPSRRGETDFTHLVNLAFTVHGQTVVRDIPARIQKDGDTVTVEAAGRYRFTEFGIKPFSALAGAVQNQDEFDLYVHLVGRKKN